MVEIESQWTARKREQMGVVVGIIGQNPRPFGCAQGRLCRRKRDKDGAPSGVEMREGVGQPPAISRSISPLRKPWKTPALGTPLLEID